MGRRWRSVIRMQIEPLAGENGKWQLLLFSPGSIQLIFS
jgi:hypothetical protein